MVMSERVTCLWNEFVHVGSCGEGDTCRMFALAWRQRDGDREGTTSIVRRAD